MDWNGETKLETKGDPQVQQAASLFSRVAEILKGHYMLQIECTMPLHPPPVTPKGARG